MKFCLFTSLALLALLGGCTRVTPAPEAELDVQVQSTWQIEAEAKHAIRDAEASGQEAAILYRTGQNATFRADEVPTGRYKVSVRARAHEYSGWPVMRLGLDGRRLGDNPVKRIGYGEDAQKFGEAELERGQVITATFTNDFYRGSAAKDRNLIVDYLILEPTAQNFDTLSSCTDARLETESRYYPVWTSDVFEGDFCREIVGDGERLALSLDAEEGGFDTAVVAPFDPVRVDDLPDLLRVEATISPQFSGSGLWWAGPKFSVREDEDFTQGLAGNYENYVVENASRAPEAYHERLSEDGAYLGETRQDGSVYKHYRKVHKDWEQFWAVRQEYRESGTVDLAVILAAWRENGLPNEIIRSLRINVETYGEVEGTLEMNALSFPPFLE